MSVLRRAWVIPVLSWGAVSGADISVIRCVHRVRCSAARASRKLGVVLCWYQGLGIQVSPSGCSARYQHQVAACSHRDRQAARSGPWRFHDCGFWPPRSCLVSRKQTSMDHRLA